MPRSLQSVTLAFGLVNVPVKLYAATKSKAVAFHWLDPQGNRVKQKLYSDIDRAASIVEPTTSAKDLRNFQGKSLKASQPSPLPQTTTSPGSFAKDAGNLQGRNWKANQTSAVFEEPRSGADEKEVPRESLLKGYEVSRNRYVSLTTDELKALEESANQHAEIQEFVPLATVDPVYFEKTYYLGPEKGAEKVYRLLAHALRRRDSGAVAKLVMRRKEKMVLVRPNDKDGLILEMLYWGDEVQDFQQLQLPDITLKEAELNLADKLIESLTNEKWQPEKYHDTYRERVLELISKKQQGEQISAAPKPTGRGQVMDLMEALKRSLEKNEKRKEPAKAVAKEAHRRQSKAS
jgi:DNA end-binding protein Ku